MNDQAAGPLAKEQQVWAESEGAYRSLVELSPDAMFISEDRIVKYANPAALKLLEVESAADIVGQSVKTWAVEEFKPVLEERVRGINRGETQPLREIRCVRPGAISLKWRLPLRRAK